MKEPQRIKLDPSTPTAKTVTTYKLEPAEKSEWNISDQDNDDVYVKSDLEEINKTLDKINREDNS